MASRRSGANGTNGFHWAFGWADPMGPHWYHWMLLSPFSRLAAVPPTLRLQEYEPSPVIIRAKVSIVSHAVFPCKQAKAALACVQGHAGSITCIPHDYTKIDA
jgi:hypothetical protein